MSPALCPYLKICRHCLRHVLGGAIAMLLLTCFLVRKALFRHSEKASAEGLAHLTHQHQFALG